MMNKVMAAPAAAALMVLTGIAEAGPAVQVTVRNMTTDAAVYVVTSNNETSTQLNASPKPKATIYARESDSFSVKSNISPDTNWATVRYRAGAKQCAFNTTFVNMIGAGGIKTPKWEKSATSANGAVCTATITRTNYSDYTWAVEFVMK
jgi:hypothetical protein